MKNLILVVMLLFSWTTVSSQNSRRLEILFLGDNGHHKPIERIPSVMSALGTKGVNFTYTDKLEDLNTNYLNKFDALMIYANWDEITPEAEKALLQYVASGKGILPIHCASFCFRNSPEYVKMVGGQFWRHRMDTIQVAITQPNHPAVKGIKGIKAFDETYLHSQLQPDNNVLMTREIKSDQAKDKPNTATEPYTWTRSYGKGRVFYTAYGHDERTWDNPDFLELLYKGILWAVDDNARKAHEALQFQAFTYNEAQLPNYEKRPDPQLRQAPLSPEESKKHIQVPVDFNFEIFAHEPNVMHPIAMTWDERGRLFVLVTKDYPNERKETGGSDYILLCEDTNNDGKADKFTKYADGLSIPTGMVFANGGLIVSQAPHMLFLKDTDGDDKVDEKKILFSGFGTFDTHAGPSNLHYGFDNWIWGCVGYAGFKGKFPGADSVKFAQGFFRFKPDGSAFEHMTSTSNNTWGFAFNETGDVFGSTANNAHGWYMAIPHRNFLSAPAIDNGGKTTDTHKDMKPITPKIRQVDVFGGFTAAAGHNFYTARAFPKKYWNKIAFVCEPTGHVVHQNNMVKKGTDYVDAEAFNLLAGADEWVSPVFAEVGPDGAVWIADWYSYIIQHNPTPKGFSNGAGNAYETPLRDYTHGRIYRVSWKDAPNYQAIALSRNNPQELIKALSSTNMFWRLQAQRLLVERGQKDVVPQLVALLKDQSLDETGINPTVIHAIRTLEGLGALTDPQVLSAVTACLKHPCHGVRKTVVQVLPRTQASVTALLNNKALDDQEPLVVMNTVLALSEMPLTSESKSAILAKLETSSDVNDRWLPDAFASALTSHNRVLLKEELNRLGKKQKQATHDHSEMAHHDHSAMVAAATTVTKNTSTNSQTADLVVTNVRTNPASPSVREPIQVSFDIKNQGGKAIAKGTVVPVTIRLEGQGRLINWISKNFDAGIAPNETVTIDKYNNGPWVGGMNFVSDVAGDYKIIVEIDKENVLKDETKNNNTFTYKLTYQAPLSLASYAVERAVRSYAYNAPLDSVIAILKLVPNMDATDSRALIKGLSEGWNYKRSVALSENDKQFLVSLSKNYSTDDRLKKLLQGWAIKTEEAAPNTQRIVIKAVREAMQYDKKTFTVKAGQPVEIVFENPDAMQHNLVIGKPKTVEIIGKAADKMITAKDGAEKNYVPSIPQILAATPLVNPDESYKLKFTAPAQVGDYPYICTFPGHWRIMAGVMKVVK